MSQWLSGELRGRKTTLLCSYPRTLSVGCYVNRSGLINTMHIISEMKIQMPACVNYVSGAIYVSAMNVNCPPAPISPRCPSEWQSEATGQLEGSVGVDLPSVPQTSLAGAWTSKSDCLSWVLSKSRPSRPTAVCVWVVFLDLISHPFIASNPHSVGHNPPCLSLLLRQHLWEKPTELTFHPLPTAPAPCAAFIRSFAFDFNNGKHMDPPPPPPPPPPVESHYFLVSCCRSGCSFNEESEEKNVQQTMPMLCMS